VIDYGRLEVASEDLGVEQALMVTLREFKEVVMAGFPGAPGSPRDRQQVLPDQVWIDAGYTTQVVYAFCREAGMRFRPAVGRGASQQRSQWYNRPTQTGSVCKFIGEGYHANQLEAEQLLLLEIDADHWKTWVHQRLATPMGSPGAMTLFKTAQPQDHLSLAKHLTAEVKTEEFVAGKGTVVKWERLRRQNHRFDALYNACAAAHSCGVKLVEENLPPPEPPWRPQPHEIAQNTPYQWYRERERDRWR
jgi:hypothetical protein